MTSALDVCVQRYLDALEAAAPGLRQNLAPATAQALPRVFAVSDFVAEACIRDPQLLPDLVAHFGLERPL